MSSIQQIQTVSAVGSIVALQQKFPAVVQISTNDLATTLGIAVKTVNNAGDDFFIKPIRIGRRKFFRLVDVACWMDSQLGIQQQEVPCNVMAPPPVGAKRAPGRPRKVAAVQKAGVAS